MKILHTSDLHIGKKVNGFSMIDDQKHVLEQIVNIANKEEVDVVLLAGDIYDRSIPPVEAVEVLDKFLEKILIDLNIPVVMISGNHDSGERLSFGSNIMKSKGLHIEGEYREGVSKVSIKDADFYMFPYVEPAVVQKMTEDDDIKNHNDAIGYLLKGIKGLDKSKVNIALYHGYVVPVTGDKLIESDSERRSSVGGACEVSAELFEDFDYVALGHLHGPQRVGDERVRYSGSPLKYSFSEEKQKKGVVIVEAKQGEEIRYKKIPLIAKREMVTVSGTLEELLKGRAIDDKSTFLRVQLGAEEVIDPMNKLRQVYPNVMILEKEEVFQNKVLKKKDIKKLRGLDTIELFGQFYQDTYNECMTNGEIEIAEKIIKIVEEGEL